jgi:hypothetical protein
MFLIDPLYRRAERLCKFDIDSLTNIRRKFTPRLDQNFQLRALKLRSPIPWPFAR